MDLNKRSVDVHYAVMQNKSITVYSYFKEKYNLVNKAYAKKVLGVGDAVFKKLQEEFNLNSIEMRDPVAAAKFNAKLYDFTKVKEIKNILQKRKEEKALLRSKKLV